MSVALRRRPGALPVPAALGEPLVDARGVSVAYGPSLVLDGVDVSVAAGEVLAIVGPNGAGKSTLLAVLAGDQTPECGSVRVDGTDVRDWSPADLARRRAVLLQRETMSFPFTVVEVVQMGRAPWTATAAEALDDSVVAEALYDTDTARFANRVVTSLSGGERARVALARALAQQTGVLLLDEPTAALDVRHQEQVLGLAVARARAGAAVVVVLHDLDCAAAHADRVLLLSAGQVRALGRPPDVLTAEALSDVYQHPIDVVAHPTTGGPLILPRRRSVPPATPAGEAP